MIDVHLMKAILCYDLISSIKERTCSATDKSKRGRHKQQTFFLLSHGGQDVVVRREGDEEEERDKPYADSEVGEDLDMTVDMTVEEKPVRIGEDTKRKPVKYEEETRKRMKAEKTNNKM